MTKQQRLALAAVIISSGVVILDGSVVNLALPKIASDLHTGFTSQQWVVDGYMLSLSALILLGGTLGDIFGRKRVYVIGLIGFGVSSLLCAIVPTATTLIIARVIQGAFGALLIPGALAIINTNFTANLRGAAFGSWTAWSSAAAAGGPLLGGYLIDAFSWRSVFLINIPLIIVSLFLGLPSITESRDPRARRVDTTGAALGIVALTGVIYGLIEGPVQHWSWPTVVAVVVGVVVAGIFIRNQATAKSPMLDLKLFRSRNFSGTNVVTFAMYGALSGFLFAFIIHLQSVVGFSSLQAGLSTLPVPAFLILLSSRVGKWSARLGSRWFMTAGPITAGLGMAYLLPLHHGSNYLTGILPGVILFGLGLSLTVAPLTTTVMASVAEAHSGIASAVNNAVSRVAGLIIVALLGLLGAAQFYSFAMLLCSVLAVAAGILAYFMIRNPTAQPA